MKSLARLIVCGLLLSYSTYAQELVRRVYLVKVETTEFNPYSGANIICLVVWEDGRYRIEKTHQDPSGGKPETRVFLDALPEASLKQLQTTLDDSQFKAISKSHENNSPIVQSLEPIQVTVPRQNAVQTFYFVNAEERKPYEKALKPFLSWFKDVQKRKVKEAKEEKPNRCATPMLQYRFGGPPPRTQEDEPQ